ncbi:MAG: DUF1553 domain-containing protein [Planctomycetaceae bacterium]
MSKSPGFFEIGRMMQRSRPGRRLLSCGLALVMTASAACAQGNNDSTASADGRQAASQAVSIYQEHVKPVLRQRCFACHGALRQEAGLRLDSADLITSGGDSGPAVVPGEAAQSLLLDRISSAEPAERMPPEHEGEPLSREQIRFVEAWIAAGAFGPADEVPEADPTEHWAFQTVVRPDVPQVSPDWAMNPVDAFLAASQQQHGLHPQPEAERIVLLRRLHLDLIGIPPTAEPIAQFENDRSAEWYQAAVDRLLNDPRHGERWARHWMDVWRYSDWWGLGEQLRNSQKHIWHWRDWIIESLNSDVPYDEMLRLMLAADELYPDDPDKLRATGFLARNYFLFNRVQWMDETVEHVSKGFLGLTMNCTRCHDHKYDPFEQLDYYRMRAFFEPYHVRLDVVPGEPDLQRDGLPRVFDAWPDVPTHRYIRGDEKNSDTSVGIPPGVPELLAFRELDIAPVDLPVEAWQPQRQPWVIDNLIAAAQQEVVAAEQALDAIAPAATSGAETSGATTGAAADSMDRRVAEAALVLSQAKLKEVQCRAAAWRAVWNEASPDVQQATHNEAVRAAREFAVAQAQHGLAVAERNAKQAAEDKKPAAVTAAETARATLEAARQAAAADPVPTDALQEFVGAKWTATRFLNSGADDPAPSFLPQSTGRRSALARWITDRRNPLTARVAVNHIWMRHMGEPLVPAVFDFGRKSAAPTHRKLLDWLAAEFMDHDWDMKHLHRIIVSSAAYRMSSSTAGAKHNLSIDPENRYWWRRTPVRLESQVVRDSLLSLAGTLDPTIGGPPVENSAQDTSTRRGLYFFHSNNDRNLFLTTFDEALVKDCYRREQSIVPQQALALTNSRLALDAAQNIAARLSATSPDDAAFVKNAFRVLVGINPDDQEMSASLDALKSWRSLPDGSADAARTSFVHVLINHNDFVTLR